MSTPMGDAAKITYSRLGSLPSCVRWYSTVVWPDGTRFDSLGKRTRREARVEAERAIAERAAAGEVTA